MVRLPKILAAGGLLEYGLSKVGRMPFLRALSSIDRRGHAAELVEAFKSKIFDAPTFPGPPGPRNAGAEDRLRARGYAQGNVR